MKKDKTVFVGLSGGVDSSVAALRLKNEGYTVVGVFIKVWHPPFLVCDWEQERLDAMRVAAHLEIPFLTCNAEEAYKSEVADYFISEYKKGRTPNPDVMCNRAVKFGAFLEFAKANKADFIATGHYAQNENGVLCRGVDTNKDQSYFLWTLQNEQLAQILLPIGKSTKDEIRSEAKAADIPTATKKDSQGICFLGHIDIPEFLSNYADLQTGQVLDESGGVIGSHKGALVYTLGQRHGFSLHTDSKEQESMYVIAKDIKNNTITVAPTIKSVGSDSILKLDEIVLREEVLEHKIYSFQFRYRQKPIPCSLKLDTEKLLVSPTISIDMPAAGQSVVIYDGDKCIGGGILE